MYIKAWRNKKISLTAQDSVVVEGGDAPCFAVCALVCDLSPRAECVYPLSLVKANVGRL